MLMARLLQSILLKMVMVGGGVDLVMGGYYCASLLFIIPELPRAVIERPKHSVRS